MFIRPRASRPRARSFAWTVALLTMAMAVGCARQVVQISQPVGPNPSPASVVNTGRLVVSTEEMPAPYDENQSTTHRPYTVLDASKKLVLEVDNFTGADVVALPAGQYTVLVDADQNRSVSVPVRIVAGRTTEAHLDGKWTPAGADRNALIKGPDGSMIGFRAELGVHSAQNP